MIKNKSGYKNQQLLWMFSIQQRVRWTYGLWIRTVLNCREQIQKEYDYNLWNVDIFPDFSRFVNGNKWVEIKNEKVK